MVENHFSGQILSICQVTVYAEKESGEALENVDNIHWVYGRKISEQFFLEKLHFFQSYSYCAIVNVMIASQSPNDFLR